MVPSTWKHPKDARGHHVPMHARSYEEALQEWEKYAAAHGTEEAIGYMGERPRPEDYMPSWTAEEKTHLMMYETTSEGTPISPAFATPEELARWLADNKASAFGNMTATYEQWLATAKRGWAPSMVMSGGVMASGVAIDDLPKP